MNPYFAEKINVKILLKKRAGKKSENSCLPLIV